MGLLFVASNVHLILRHALTELTEKIDFEKPHQLRVASLTATPVKSFVLASGESSDKAHHVIGNESTNKHSVESVDSIFNPGTLVDQDLRGLRERFRREVELHHSTATPSVATELPQIRAHSAATTALASAPANHLFNFGWRFGFAILPPVENLKIIPTKAYDSKVVSSFLSVEEETQEPAVTSESESATFDLVSEFRRQNKF